MWFKAIWVFHCKVGFQEWPNGCQSRLNGFTVNKFGLSGFGHGKFLESRGEKRNGKLIGAFPGWGIEDIF
jgi:hypothetical protein